MEKKDLLFGALFLAVFLGSLNCAVSEDDGDEDDAVIIDAYGPDEDDDEAVVIDSGPLCLDPPKQTHSFFKTGRRAGLTTAFSYVPEANECQSFLFQGSPSSTNRFATKLSCEQACLDTVEEGCFNPPGDDSRCQADGQECVLSLEEQIGCSSCCCIDLGFDRSVCSQPKESGPLIGRANILQWFYNSQTEQCESFIFSGLGEPNGKANRFPCKEMCERQCVVQV